MAIAFNMNDVCSPSNDETDVVAQNNQVQHQDGVGNFAHCGRFHLDLNVGLKVLHSILMNHLNKMKLLLFKGQHQASMKDSDEQQPSHPKRSKLNSKEKCQILTWILNKAKEGTLQRGVIT